jgi:hypothetical protein
MGKEAIEIFKLKIEKIYHVQVVSNELISDNLTVDVSALPYFENDQTVIRSIYRLAVYEELLCRYPADWWQAFKERWFPKWLKYHYPIKTKEVIAKHKFPHFHYLGKEYVEIIMHSPDYLKM